MEIRIIRPDIGTEKGNFRDFQKKSLNSFGC
jgi:hypothetical protein